MGYEIDFFDMGDRDKAGDAICLRYGDLMGDRANQKVVVIDGGYKDTGERMVEHIRKYYKTDRINQVFLTHSHQDHASGLKVVLEEMQVDALFMHLPWERSHEIHEFFKDGRVTSNSAQERLLKSLTEVAGLEEIAHSKGIEIIEPFSDNYWDSTDELIVLGPSQEYYAQCCAAILDEKANNEAHGRLAKWLMEKRAAMAESARQFIEDRFDFETLPEPGPNEVTPANNASLVLLLQTEGAHFLFTGDAGVPALTRALDHADAIGLAISRPQGFKLPHHGSRHNVGPTLLDRILGTKHEHKLTDDELDRSAYVCCAIKSAPKHPHGFVINACRRRGYAPYVCDTYSVCRHKDAPNRGWSKSTPVPYQDQVED